MGKLIYKKNVISGKPKAVNTVQAGDTNLVTSGAVNDALTEYFIIRKIRKNNVSFETGKGYITITDDALIIPDGYSFFTISLGIAHPGSIMLGPVTPIDIVNNNIYIPYYSIETRESTVEINLILIKN